MKSKTNSPADDRAKLQSFYQAALKNRLAAAFWKLPGETSIQAILGSAVSIKANEFKLNESKGFVFAPFNTEKENLLIINPQFIFEGKSIFGTDYGLGWLSGRPLPDLNKDRNKYEALVTLGISAIKKGQLEKVVLSRAQPEKLPEDFSPMDFFHKLCDEYRDAFTSLVSIPGIGTWIGATPELLLEVRKEGLRTVALAATQNGEGKPRPWSAKELEEQAFVKNYIVSLFKEIGTGPPEESDLENIKAGNLLHLYTEFRIKASPAKISSLADKLLLKLHPTPAVAGIPRKKAMDFISVNEGYERQFYSGFLGPVNMGKTTQLYVNLRCMQLFEKHALLYAGAGITADSDPVKEWEETEQKLRTLLDLLFEK